MNDQQQKQKLSKQKVGCRIGDLAKTKIKNKIASMTQAQYIDREQEHKPVLLNKVLKYLNPREGEK